MAPKETLLNKLHEDLYDIEILNAKLGVLMNLHHEIQTPLTLINTSLLTLMKEDDDPHRRGIYDTMRRNAERILKLTGQVLDVSKMELGMMKMHMCETELIGFISDIHQLFAQQSKAKMIILDFHHDMPMLPVWLDRSQFDKVLVNLLSNAFKYTPVGGTITTRVESDDRHAYIYIRDTGIGIPEDRMPYIFDRYYQASLTVDERNIGTGIGLDLTHMLVVLHHGTIEVRNNTDGPGCEFKITLPLGCEHLSAEEMLLEKDDVKHYNYLLEEEEEPAYQPMNSEHKESHRTSIVVVEDEADVRDFLVSELQGLYDVTACTNGREGLATVGALQPDLVISDVWMPEMDGHVLCSKIKSNSTTSHIPVILITSNTGDDERLTGLEADADAYVPKPFNMDILRRIIVNLLHRYRMLKLKYGRTDQLEELLDDVQVKSPDDQLLERVMAVINKNLTNFDLSIDMIADEVGISRVHLHRKMKELTGQTPYDYIRSIRLKRAAQLLADGGKNIAEVMYACGFSSAASFSTLFKKTYGMSPRQYMTGRKTHTF